MHDFAITRDNVVFFDQPAVFDLELLGTRGFPVTWKPENGARVGVLRRGGTGADIRWYDTELGYTFHPMNAYERDDGATEVLLPIAPSVFAEPHLVLDEAARQSFQRWIIEPKSGTVHQELIDDTPQDFCRINERLLGSRHRYGYTAAIGAELLYDDTRVFKHDFARGTRDEHDFGDGRHPGEMVFVADPARSDQEDGGWLLGLVHDDAVDRTSLVVLDAQRVGDPPVAQVHVPRRIPYGFHGTWSADPGSEGRT
jgi:carotenoid cleavage dioxygenase